jgi:hypothetical protein
MTRWGIAILLSILLTACNQLSFTPIPIDDGFEHLLWVGDDQLMTGPLDMQTLLLIELSGDSQTTRMHRAVSPRFTLSTNLNKEELNQSIKLESMDFVFIQAFSIQRNFSDDDFEKNAMTWIDFIRSQGKEVVIFYPWFSAVDSRADIERLDRLVHEITWQENLILVPVGPAWMAAQEQRPYLKLHASDGIHPSAAGVYLSACVFYASITGESPLDNPVYTSIGFDNPDEIIKLDGDTIQFLQRIAWETVNEYLQKDEFKVIIKP